MKKLKACKSNSFVPGTGVLMADGSIKAIEDAFHLREGERFPAIGAASGEFGVVAYPAVEGSILLVTDDPAEAVAFAARLIHDRIGELDGTTAPGQIGNLTD